MTTAERTIFLSDYQPPTFSVVAVFLDFDLYDDCALVKSDLQIVRQRPGPLHLNGEALELIRIEQDGIPLAETAYRRDGDDLVITDCKDACTLTIVTRIEPQKNTQLSGLYRSNELFCTQCEAEGFRRITYFPDRPDVLAQYTTRICADRSKYPVLLSNGNAVDAGEMDNGRHWVVWHDPFKKPCYLFALVAGRLSVVCDEWTTCSGRVVALRIYVEPGHEDKCQHAMASLKKAMRWDEEQFGREYDLDVFMIVAVSDFNMGAMENKGLNIFNSKYILASPDTATDHDYAGIESVVAHEYFHNWTGNRVTCRDWFQLSLKEGLTVFRDQEFSRDMNSRDVNRILDVKTLRQIQFPEDAGRMAHPVRPDSYQEISNFYTATVYNKGAEVIRMQRTLLGADGFRRGMDLYFERHDGQAVTIDEFVSAMEDANGVDFTQFKRWYYQAGTPVVRVSSEYEAQCLRLTLSQSCPTTQDGLEKAPFHIPIRCALFDKKNPSSLLHSEVLALRDASQTFEFKGLVQEPLVSLLRDFSAPIALDFPNNMTNDIALMRVETDGFAQWDAAQRLALLCLTACYNTSRSDWHVSAALLDAYQHVLQDERLDCALRAELLTPPGFEDVMALLHEADVERVEAVRDFFRETLGRALFELAETKYHELWQQEDHAMNGPAYGRRKLRNACLWLMMKADECSTLSVCESQFLNAHTMTDRMASLSLLVNSSNSEVRERALDAFYRQWQHDELVMDKWFSLQATSEVKGALARVQALQHHPLFHITNPNKVRALIGAFCQANPRHFHARDGQGYAFLAETLLTLDQINPQIAARLATPFTRWPRLDAERQADIQRHLAGLATMDLSRDLREVVEKSRVVL